MFATPITGRCQIPLIVDEGAEVVCFVDSADGGGQEGYTGNSTKVRVFHAIKLAGRPPSRSRSSRSPWKGGEAVGYRICGEEGTEPDYSAPT